MGLMGKEMSMSVMNKGGGVKGSSGYVHGMSCISVMDPQEICNNIGDGEFLVEKKMVAKKEELSKALNTSCSSSSTSSIGKNSDVSEKSMENSGETEEVQSSYKGPLDAMEALEEVLPIRRGISRFYNGKSKSFASLGDAASSTSSIKEIAKPENAYMRKRRNLLACSLAWDNNNKNRSSLLKSNGGGVSKRVCSSSRSSLALAVTMSNSGINNIRNENLSPYANTISGSPSSLLRACLHSQFRESQSNGSSLSSPRQNFSAWRSLSLADLQQCFSVTAACTSTTTTQLDIKPSHT